MWHVYIYMILYVRNPQVAGSKPPEIPIFCQPPIPWNLRRIVESRPTTVFGTSSPTAQPRAAHCWWLALQRAWPSWAAWNGGMAMAAEREERLGENDETWRVYQLAFWEILSFFGGLWWFMGMWPMESGRLMMFAETSLAIQHAKLNGFNINSTSNNVNQHRDSKKQLEFCYEKKHGMLELSPMVESWWTGAILPEVKRGDIQMGI